MAPSFWQILGDGAGGWTAVGLFWCLCAGVLVFQTWRGWRQGLWRELSVVGALGAAWWVGRPPGESLLPPLKSIIASVVVYVLIILAGRLLFKPVHQQPFGPRRIISGATGAVVGLLLGLFGVWVLILGERLAAAVAEGEPGLLVAGPLIEIKQSLERGWIGEGIRHTDPLPGQTYANLSKIARVAAEPRLQQRVLQMPAVQKLAQDPKVEAFRRDPAALAAMQRRDFVALMRNSHLLAILNDPGLMQRMEKVDLTRLLKETLEPPPRPPTPPPPRPVLPRLTPPPSSLSAPHLAPAPHLSPAPSLQ